MKHCKGCGTESGQDDYCIRCNLDYSIKKLEGPEIVTPDGPMIAEKVWKGWIFAENRWYKPSEVHT